jgi:hypothetical protein
MMSENIRALVSYRLAYHRLVSVLEQPAVASISPVERYGIPGWQSPHQGTDPLSDRK